MRKISLYAISDCPVTASNKEFLENLCTFVYKKKDIYEYLLNKLILEHFSHFHSWLEMKYPNFENMTYKEEDEAKQRYAEDVLGEEAFMRFTVKKQTYTPEGIACVFRIMNGCIPVGAKYESEVELETLSAMAESVAQELGVETSNKKA